MRTANSRVDTIPTSWGAKVTTYRADPVIVDQGGRLTAIDPAQGREWKIRQRAYELYEGRGKAEGYAEADWLEAEAQVLGIKGAW